jgi:hypothetical protein
MGIRRKLLYFYIFKVIKVPEGERLPKSAMFLRWLLFPIETFLITGTKDFKYDIICNIYTIHGVKYSGFLFHSLGMNGIETGTTFRLVNRENGVLCLERVNNENSSTH